MTRADAAAALLTALGNGTFRGTVKFVEQGGTLSASVFEPSQGRVTVTRTGTITFRGRPFGATQKLSPKGRRAISKAAKAMWVRRKAASSAA